MIEGDTLWHIKTGQWIIENHRVPIFDIYSWTVPGTHWTAHEWLWEVFAYLSYTSGGKWGVWFLTCIGIIIYALSMWFLLKRRCSLPLVSFFSVLVLVAINVWDARPHVMAQGLFAFTVYLVLTAEDSPRKLYLLPFVTLIWVNMHSSAPLGVLFAAGVYVYSFFFDDAPVKNVYKKLGISALAMLLASFCSQQGPKIWYYAFFASSNSDITNNIAEWFSPNFHSPANLLALGLLILGIVIPVLIKKQPSLFDTLFVALTCALWLVSHRHISYFVLAEVLFLSSLVKDIKISHAFRSMTALLIIVLFACSVGLLPPSWINNPRETVYFPTQAVSYMKENNLTEKVFNHYSWGGLLIWENIPVFIDGRADMYIPSGKNVFKDYLDAVMPIPYSKRIKKPRDPVQILHDWGVQTALIPSGGSLDWILMRQKNWKEVYRDKTAVVYRKAG